jgi:hypothetical protein
MVPTARMSMIPRKEMVGVPSGAITDETRSASLSVDERYSPIVEARKVPLKSNTWRSCAASSCLSQSNTPGRSMTQRTWFVAGINTGFGRLMTEQLLSRGDRVAGTVRKATSVDDLKARHGDRIWVAHLDVTDTEIRKGGLYNEIWQAFAVLLPVRTVGVMGDGRTYDQACAPRAVMSTDT